MTHSSWSAFFFRPQIGPGGCHQERARIDASVPANVYGHPYSLQIFER
jgi:hypothetical protein